MSIEGASAPLLIPGTEVVDFRSEFDATFASDTAIVGLATFTHNNGIIRIKSDVPHIPLAIMYTAPTHFSNFPRTQARNYEPYDVIVSPETKLGAHEMATHLSGQQLNNTRYIFPDDGVVLQESGFTDELVLSEVVAQAIETTSRIPYYELFHTRKATGVRRWIGQKIMNNLNKTIGEIPEAEKAPPLKAEQQIVRRKRTKSELEEFARFAVELQRIQNPKIILQSERFKIVQQMDAYAWENSPKNRSSWYN